MNEIHTAMKQSLVSGNTPCRFETERRLLPTESKQLEGHGASGLYVMDYSYCKTNGSWSISKTHFSFYFVKSFFHSHSLVLTIIV